MRREASLQSCSTSLCCVIMTTRDVRLFRGDHQTMPSIRLGLERAPDFLAKARRELQRYQNADDPADRADHALNLAVTIHHLADWTYHHGLELGCELGNIGNFLGRARDANGSVKLLHKIADTTKHHTLSRQNVLNIQVDEVGHGRLTVHQDFLGIDVQRPQTSVPGGRLLGVRTLIDDDEVVGYESIFEGMKVTNRGVGRFFDPICEEAITFWDEVIRELEAGNRPIWL